MNINQVLASLKNVKRTLKGWTARCPAHDDKKNSLSIKEGDNGQPIFFCHAKCEYQSILTALELKPRLKSKGARKEIVAEYPYLDEMGQLLYQSVRYEPKDFRQRRPNGSGGYVWNLDGVRRVLYRLPKLLAADKAESVFICEGEKDCDRLIGCSLVATTNSGGAGKWSDDYNEHLRERNVVILPDNDEPGYCHAEQVAQSLNGIAASVKIVTLPNLPDKGDVSEWLNAGNTIEDFLSQVAKSPEWKPPIVSDRADDEIEPQRERKQSQGSRLVALASDAEFFHSADGKAYVSVRVGNHMETMLLNSRSFKDWLSRLFFLSQGTTPSAQGMNDALSVLSGRARFDGTEHEVHIRIASYGDYLYLDLCDAAWRIVQIRPDGWSIIESNACPVKFRRTRGMLPLHEPVRGGSLDDLWRLINVSRDARPLVAGFLVASLRPNRPFPLLALHGEQGSAKSTTERILRALVDPNIAPLRSEPRDIRDLMIASVNGWYVAFDNLSNISPVLSDALCRLATGGGFATRELHTDAEEIIFDAMRPIILNGIEELSTRSDLLDRSLIIYLQTILETERRTEAEIWKEFETVRASILGVLLDGASAALRNIAEVNLARLPRMADFARWATAAEVALCFNSGEFMNAYDDNRESANTMALEASPTSAAVLALIGKHKKWTGTATDLLPELRKYADETVQRQTVWPKTPKAISNALRRVAPNLRAAGIALTFSREAGSGKRLISLYENRNLLSQPSRTSRTTEKGVSCVTVCDDSDAPTTDSSHRLPNENGRCDADDDCDDQNHIFLFLQMKRPNVLRLWSSTGA